MITAKKQMNCVELMFSSLLCGQIGAGRYDMEGTQLHT